MGAAAAATAGASHPCRRLRLGVEAAALLQDALFDGADSHGDPEEPANLRRASRSPARGGLRGDEWGQEEVMSSMENIDFVAQAKRRLREQKAKELDDQRRAMEERDRHKR